MTTLSFEPGPNAVPGCDLCAAAGGLLLWSEGDWRVIRVDDAAFPAFYRVVCNHHVAEFSDLPDEERQRCMSILCAIERVLLERLQPTKVNLAALGNMVPHLHWHVVARFAWDSHFPQAIWGARQRDVVDPPAVGRLPCTLAQLDAAVLATLQRLS